MFFLVFLYGFEVDSLSLALCTYWTMLPNFQFWLFPRSCESKLWKYCLSHCMVIFAIDVYTLTPALVTLKCLKATGVAKGSTYKLHFFRKFLSGQVQTLYSWYIYWHHTQNAFLCVCQCECECVCVCTCVAHSPTQMCNVYRHFCMTCIAFCVDMCLLLTVNLLPQNSTVAEGSVLKVPSIQSVCLGHWTLMNQRPHMLWAHHWNQSKTFQHAHNSSFSSLTLPLPENSELSCRLLWLNWVFNHKQKFHFFFFFNSLPVLQF